MYLVCNFSTWYVIWVLSGLWFMVVKIKANSCLVLIEFVIKVINFGQVIIKSFDEVP